MMIVMTVMAKREKQPCPIVLTGDTNMGQVKPN